MQIKFKKDITLFVKVVKQLGKPFLGISEELEALDMQNVMEMEVVS